MMSIPPSFGCDLFSTMWAFLANIGEMLHSYFYECCTLLIGFSLSFLLLIKFSTVKRFTPSILEIALTLTFLDSNSVISFSFPVSFVRLDKLPFGRPNFLPSLFFQARASLVL